MFYCGLFRLEVAWREAETADGWRTLPEGAGWEDAESAGIALGIVMLYWDGVRLALEAVESVADNGQLSHLGVHADEDELVRISKAAAASRCQIVVNSKRALIFDDPFGVRWELNSFPYDNPRAMSTGARTGNWLQLPG